MIYKRHATLPTAMVDLKLKLAYKMRRLRGEQTFRAFGRKIGFDPSHLSRIEQAKENVTIKTLQRLCEALKCPIADLFDDK